MGKIKMFCWFLWHGIPLIKYLDERGLMYFEDAAPCAWAVAFWDIDEVPWPNKPGDYRQAIGAAPGFLGDTLPEEAIRKGRDG